MFFLKKIFSAKQEAPVVDETKKKEEMIESLNIPYDDSLNCKNMVCPMPIFEISKKIKSMEPGKTLRVACTDPAFENDIRVWCKRTNNELSQIKHIDHTAVVFIIKS